MAFRFHKIYNRARQICLRVRQISFVIDCVFNMKRKTNVVFNNCHRGPLSFLPSPKATWRKPSIHQSKQEAKGSWQEVSLCSWLQRERAPQCKRNWSKTLGRMRRTAGWDEALHLSYSLRPNESPNYSEQQRIALFCQLWYVALGPHFGASIIL